MNIQLPNAIDLHTLVAEWNHVVEELVKTHGEVEGTRTFLKATLNHPSFGGKTALVSSFGIEAAVPLALAAGIKRDIPIIFIDTGYTFPEVSEYRDQLKNLLKLSNVKTYSPTAKQIDSFDPFANPYRGCEQVKKELLDEALKEFNIWVSGRKRYQGDMRSNIPMVEASEGKLKINPMALWSEAGLQVFMKDHNLPQHPMLEKGYESVGCWSCTVPGKGRSGRWPGAGKSECGIHGYEIDGSGI